MDLFSIEYQKTSYPKILTNIKFEGTDIDFIRAKIMNIKALKNNTQKKLHNSEFIHDINIDYTIIKKHYTKNIFLSQIILY
jgi:hypothetical protein